MLSLFLILFLHILWIQNSFDYPDLLKRAVKNEETNVINGNKVNLAVNNHDTKQSQIITTDLTNVGEGSRVKINETNYTPYSRSLSLF